MAVKIAYLKKVEDLLRKEKEVLQKRRSSQFIAGFLYATGIVKKFHEGQAEELEKVMDHRYKEHMEALEEDGRRFDEELEKLTLSD